MPTALRQGPYRLFFYASDRDEPRHVHVEREGNIAKFWLEPVPGIAEAHGLSAHELHELLDVAVQHKDEIEEFWNEYFSS